MERIPAIIQQLTDLASAVARLEMLIRNEISDLKTEQIADVKNSINRIADDQRRLWDAVRTIENARHESQGGVKALYAAFLIIGSFIGSFITAIVPRLLK